MATVGIEKTIDGIGEGMNTSTGQIGHSMKSNFTDNRTKGWFQSIVLIIIIINIINIIIIYLLLLEECIHKIMMMMMMMYDFFQSEKKKGKERFYERKGC